MQPSELAKLATAIALAQFLAAKKRDPARWSTLLPAAGMVLLPLALVLKEPDLGTSGAFAVMGIAMVLWSGLPWLHTLLMMSPLASLILCRHYVFWAAYLVVSVLVLWRVRLSWLVLALFVVIQTAVMFGAPVLWNHLEPYQRMRLTVFEHPERDPSGGGYQIMQSKIAIGSGGIWGKGYLKGSQKALAFLPQQHTDFIYSVVGEEAGFLGCLATIILFLLVILRGYYLALHCRSPFAGLLAVGIATSVALSRGSEHGDDGGAAAGDGFALAVRELRGVVPAVGLRDARVAAQYLGASVRLLIVVGTGGRASGRWLRVAMDAPLCSLASRIRAVAARGYRRRAPLPPSALRGMRLGTPRSATALRAPREATGFHRFDRRLISGGAIVASVPRRKSVGR